MTGGAFGPCRFVSRKNKNNMNAKTCKRLRKIARIAMVGKTPTDYLINTKTRVIRRGPSVKGFVQQLKKQIASGKIPPPTQAQADSFEGRAVQPHRSSQESFA
jgi:hypothetical protein